MNSELEPRNILFSEFLDSRTLEISHMDRILREKSLSTTKLSFQLLPKHMRRRPMSHNKYRIPSRIRPKNQENPSAKANICRKHLRKPRLLSLRYQMRDSKRHWLETHLYQAKRMKMFEYFGYKIAKNPVDKSQRACYRFFSHDAVMYDLSYHEIYELKASEKELRNFMKKFLKKMDFEKIFRKECVSGAKTGRVFLWKNCEKGDLIGPVEFYWKPKEICKETQEKKKGNEKKEIYEEKNEIKKDSEGNNENKVRSLYFLAHPGLKEELSEIFTKEIAIEMKFIENSMNIFEIFGPKSLKKVSSVLKKLGFEPENGSLLKNFSTITDPEVYPKGSVFYVNFMKKCLPKKIISDRKSQEIKEDCKTFDKEKALEINKAIIEISLYNFEEKNTGFCEENNIWRIPEASEYLKRFKEVIRGRFTHKKKIVEKNLQKLTRKEKKKKKLSEKLKKSLEKTLLKEVVINMDIEKITKNNIEENTKEKINENLKEIPKGIPKENLEEKTLSLMFSFGQYSSGSGLKIFVPMGFGLLFWRFFHLYFLIFL